MFSTRQGLSLLSFLTAGTALAPGRRDDVQAAYVSPLASLSKLAPSVESNVSINIAQLRDKIPESVKEFLRKEDRLQPHYHVGTKEQRAQRQAAATLELLQLFRPCARCSHYQRYGSKHDGGYVMCEELMKGTKAAYSFGVNGNSGWDADVTQKYGVPVYQFDCYHTERPRCPAGGRCDFHFVPECLGLSPQNDSHIFRSLEDHLQINTPLHGQPNPRGGDLLLKVDVEGKEWNAFMDSRVHDLRRMRQIAVEFHSISRVEFHESFVDTLRHIQKAGFLVAHIHGNNFGPMALFGDGAFKLADNVEVTLVNKLAFDHAVDATCRTTQEKLVEDAANNPFNFDLPIPQLPGEHDTIRPARLLVLRCRWWCSVYAVALGIGPFVLLSGFIVALMTIFGLLVSRPIDVSRKPSSRGKLDHYPGSRQA